jgi:hypothetical protein
MRRRAELFYHREVRYGIGLADLAARKAIGLLKTFAWHFVIGAPRRMKGRAELFYHREVKYGIGLADLGARRTIGTLKVFAWHLMIGKPKAIWRVLLRAK